MRLAMAGEKAHWLFYGLSAALVETTARGLKCSDGLIVCSKVGAIQEVCF